jgi:hypothetical protein
MAAATILDNNAIASNGHNIKSIDADIPVRRIPEDGGLCRNFKLVSSFDNTPVMSVSEKNADENRHGQVHAAAIIFMNHGYRTENRPSSRTVTSSISTTQHYSQPKTRKPATAGGRNNLSRSLGKKTQGNRRRTESTAPL